MRSIEIYRALDQISNRFALCQVISQSARRIHRDGDPVQKSVSDALHGVERGDYKGVTSEVVPPVAAPAILLFHPADVL